MAPNTSRQMAEINIMPHNKGKYQFGIFDFSSNSAMTLMINKKIQIRNSSPEIKLATKSLKYHKEHKHSATINKISKSGNFIGEFELFIGFFFMGHMTTIFNNEHFSIAASTCGNKFGKRF